MVLARYYISLSIKIFLVLMEVYNTVGKVSKYGVFSGSYFSGFGLNTRIFSVNRGTQSEYREMRIRKNSVFGDFSSSAVCPKQIENSTLGR